jgi:hypothetical protein
VSVYVEFFHVHHFAFTGYVYNVHYIFHWADSVFMCLQTVCIAVCDDAVNAERKDQCCPVLNMKII